MQKLLFLATYKKIFFRVSFELALFSFWCIIKKTANLIKKDTTTQESRKKMDMQEFVNDFASYSRSSVAMYEKQMTHDEKIIVLLPYNVVVALWNSLVQFDLTYRHSFRGVVSTDLSVQTMTNIKSVFVIREGFSCISITTDTYELIGNGNVN